MSHSKERSEKVCLNCNIELHGRFCHVCGQQNIEPKETVWGLITHFFYDITHFDGKFFSTVKYLVARPGLLSKEYIRGRRASYLNPIRMYVFTSAFFFIIFFSVMDMDDMTYKETASPTSDTTELKPTDTAETVRKSLATTLPFAETKADSLKILERLAPLSDSIRQALPDSIRKRVDKKAKSKKGMQFSFDGARYRSIGEYDSVQKTLPADQKDSWLEKIIYKRNIVLRQKYGDDTTALGRAWLSAFFHQFPKMLFISLPLFALILRLLYIRHRKQFFYVDHGIFSIHLYIFSFVLLLVSMGISQLGDVTGWSVFGWLQVPLWIYMLYYNYKAMRVFYGQRRGKTIVKFILLNVLAQVCIIILFAIFFVVAAFQL